MNYYVEIFTPFQMIFCIHIILDSSPISTHPTFILAGTMAVRVELPVRMMESFELRRDE